MYIPSLRGLWRLIHRRPGLLWVAALNVTGHLFNPYVKARLGGRSPWPEQVTVVVTDKCNLRCPMCHFAFSESAAHRLDQVGHMQPQVFYKLVAETPGRAAVSFTGGEPLLHPQIGSFVAYAHARRRPTTLTTNGSLLAARAAEICDAGLDLLVVSVDGPEATHDRIRGARAFERLAKGLDVVLRRSRRPVVFVSMAMSDLNADKIVEMYDVAMGLGVDGLNYSHLWMQTDEMVRAFNAEYADIFFADKVAMQIHPEKVDVRGVAEGLKAVQQRAWKGPMIVTETPFLNAAQIQHWYQEPTRPVKWKTTRCAWLRLRVWPDGGVRVCHEMIVGNIMQEPVLEVWNNSSIRNFRTLLARRGTVPICVRCCQLATR